MALFMQTTAENKEKYFFLNYFFGLYMALLKQDKREEEWHTAKGPRPGL